MCSMFQTQDTGIPEICLYTLVPFMPLTKKGKIKNSKKITKIVQLVSPSNLVHLKLVAIAKLKNSPKNIHQKV